MAYKHGIEVVEKATSFPSPLSTKYGVQIIFGTAPINLAENPYESTNIPIKSTTFDEAEKALGYSDDWQRYTLCQSMYASFKNFQISPVIFVNVLDPAKHIKEIDQKDYIVKNHQALIGVSGILMDTITVMAQIEGNQTGEAKAGESITVDERKTELEKNKDYITDFDDNGCIVVTMLSTGKAYNIDVVTVTSKVIAPELVTEEDIIGFYDVELGTETGMETLRQVYPKYGLVPGVLLAPGWSEKPNVGAALMAKCQDICGTFRSMCLLDLDTTLAKKYTDCLKVKMDLGYNDEHAIVLWPKVIKDGRVYNYSAIYGAMMSYNTAENNDVPYLYPSNKELNIDGAVLFNATEILLDQVQAGSLNGDGIVTVMHDSKWKSYGNNTGCYPGNTDPKDRWIGCRRMFDYVANYFITTYRSRIDGNMNRRLVDDIINSFNIWGNSLAAAGMCAGLYAEYRNEENNMDDVLAGRMKLRIYFAPYTPAEYINALMEFDVTALERVMSQEG